MTYHTKHKNLSPVKANIISLIAFTILGGVLGYYYFGVAGLAIGAIIGFAVTFLKLLVAELVFP